MEETNVTQAVQEIPQGDLRKFYNMKQEMSDYVVGLLRKTVPLDVKEIALLNAIGNLPIGIYQSPKIANEVIEELYNNPEAKVLLISKLATCDQTMFVRYLKEASPDLLYSIKEMMPVVMPTEKCICGKDPAVSDDGVHTCTNPECLVCKLGFQGTKEQWNALIMPHKYKKKDEPKEDTPKESAGVVEDLPF